MQNLNRWIGTGNLTRDPELRSASGGLQICKMRIACNGRAKDGATGEWVDKPNYFDVTVFGGQAENCNRYLAKGRAVAIDGRLDWQEWTAQDGSKRQAVQIIADAVQFLSDGRGEDDRGSSAAGPAGPADFAPAATSAPADDDIPF